MYIMSVDLGDARTGVALSDQSESFAFPKGTITEYNKERLVVRLADMAKTLCAELIVVGLPRNMDGSLGFRAEECTALAKKLNEVSGIKTVLFDERCSTMEAHKLLNINDVKGKKRKQTVDTLSAVIILEDYLRGRKNGAN